MTRKREFRNWKTEVRTEMVDGKKKIVGYGAVFNQLSEPMRIGNRVVRERVMPGAFDKCLASNPDIRGLINHDANKILGRTTAGTMRVGVDSHGAKYEIDPPDTTYAADLMESLSRGDIDQSSFGFYVIDDGYVSGPDGPIRELREIDCFDMSPVTFPAYTGASSGLRSAEELRSMFPDGIPESLEKAEVTEVVEEPKEKRFEVKIGDVSYSDAFAYKAARKEARAMDPDNDGDDDEPLIDSLFDVGDGCWLVSSAANSALNAFFTGKPDYANPALESFVKQAKALVDDLNEAIAEATMELSETVTVELNSRRKRYQSRFVQK